MADWRKIPEAGTVFGIRLLVLSVRMFGRRLTSGILFVVAFYYALIRGVARRASRDYLRRIGHPAGFWMVVRHIHVFAQVSLDRLFFATGKIKPFELAYDGHDELVQVAKGGKGVILLGAHLGSFEVMRCQAREYDLPINVVANFGNAERINGVLEALAPDMKTRLISIATDPIRAMLEVRAAIERGEIVAMLADRADDRGRVVTTQFLGADAAFPAGPWLMAHALHCPVYFVAGVYSSPRRYELHFRRLASEVRLDRKDRAAALTRYARSYAAMLEMFAREAPLNWFNFFDFWAAHP
ncbi:MAG: acyltransferase [Kofleriaceae bacterium]